MVAERMPHIDIDSVKRGLQTTRYGRSCTYRPQTASTNDDARNAILAGAPRGHAIVADTQTAGRGSRGRSWESPAGTDLYVSIIDSLPVAVAELPPLTLAVGLAVADTVDSLLQLAEPERANVKWPNDVLIGGKKCAGILIETSLGMPSGDWVIIGIGLNVNRLSFPPELSTATSLRLQCAQAEALDRDTALRTLLDRVEARVDAFVAEGAAATVEALLPRLSLRGQQAYLDERLGTVRGVAPSGALLFETAHGVEHVVAGRLTPL